MRCGRHSMFLAGLAITGILGWGCGKASTPPPDTSKIADGGTNHNDLGVKSDGTLADDRSTVKTVQVIYGGNNYTVDVSKPQPVTLFGAAYSRFSDLVLLALPTKILTNLTADFEGVDGFKPSSKSNCATLIPVAGDQLAKGYVQVQSLNVAWDDELGYPGCMSPRGLTKIILADK